MPSPVFNKMNTVFIHVSNLKSSVKWYSELLNQEYKMSEVKSPVYNLNIDGETGLTLDAGPEGTEKQIVASLHPIFNFHTEDIKEAYEFVKGMDYTIDSPITSFDDFSFFTIKDPDGHVVMICTG
ncbi:MULTISPECIES: VOC family protein [Priestia]|uniref:VOC family protein n=1 Tax=Priestia TaxID=2800373 RepID=UPI000BF10A52|nr:MULTISPECIES: VOC family protein [Priestia]MBY0213449.1 VOC family protein [Priestia aryabhattai]NGY85931.1 VOC family protein [Priestia megaterium]PEI59008.1 glyoxalase/bleomycin resistance/dioxygenase family protein [Priestia aryabhattai]PHF73261.1 glyoxalase/bleomycin resistance/dioxygenase family protein [Priestia aryabhattai]UOO40384.1 VOC family protein [Priestia megaterium]